MSAEWAREGRVWAFGDEVSIEYISPLRFMFNTEGRGKNCLKYLDPEFAAIEKHGDLIVVGRMFGHGPGHNHVIQETGVVGVVARSFAPQFFRHAIAHGLLVAEAPEVLELVSAGDQLSVDFSTGAAVNLTSGATFAPKVQAGPAAEIIASGGLMPYLRQYLATHPA